MKKYVCHWLCNSFLGTNEYSRFNLVVMQHRNTARKENNKCNVEVKDLRGKQRDFKNNEYVSGMVAEASCKSKLFRLNLRVYFKITLLKTVKTCEGKHTLMCFRLNPTRCLVNQCKFLSRPKCHAYDLQFTFSFQALVPHRL